MWPEHKFIGYNNKIQKDWIKKLPLDYNLTKLIIGKLVQKSSLPLQTLHTQLLHISAIILNGQMEQKNNFHKTTVTVWPSFTH